MRAVLLCMTVMWPSAKPKDPMESMQGRTNMEVVADKLVWGVAFSVLDLSQLYDVLFPTTFHLAAWEEALLSWKMRISEADWEVGTDDSLSLSITVLLAVVAVVAMLLIPPSIGHQAE
mmetsp:Transcript_9841/g.30017  ORF Transcript_9841/g.30017 Transcript_9841/m.30017 type:complete len:118 (+) Transcript_9841:440-793(+)